MKHSNENVVLIGMPGSGKSTVGVLLAKTLGRSFVDTDLTLQQQEGKLLQDILAEQGIEAFYACEARTILSLRCKGAVIATGGSVVMEPAAMTHLKGLGRVLYLDVPLEEIEGRVQNIATRGVALDEGQTLADLFALRTPLYRRYADDIIPWEGRSSEETVTEICRRFFPES